MSLSESVQVSSCGVIRQESSPSMNCSQTVLWSIWSKTFNEKTTSGFDEQLPISPTHFFFFLQKSELVIIDQ